MNAEDTFVDYRHLHHVYNGLVRKSNASRLSFTFGCTLSGHLATVRLVGCLGSHQGLQFTRLHTTSSPAPRGSILPNYLGFFDVLTTKIQNHACLTRLGWVVFKIILKPAQFKPSIPPRSFAHPHFEFQVVPRCGSPSHSLTSSRSFLLASPMHLTCNTRGALTYHTVGHTPTSMAPTKCYLCDLG